MGPPPLAMSAAGAFRVVSSRQSRHPSLIKGGGSNAQAVVSTDAAAARCVVVEPWPRLTFRGDVYPPTHSTGKCQLHQMAWLNGIPLRGKFDSV